MQSGKIDEQSMSAYKEVCVVLVTYNRKQLLKELLYSLTRQTYPISTIVIVDNASTDGTAQYLVDDGIIEKAETGKISCNEWNDIQIKYYLNSQNAGGSGGFEKAFTIANNISSDYIWAMDDDVEPEDDCLEILMRSITDHSKVCVPCRNDERWTDNIITKYNLSNPFLYNLEKIKTIVDSKTITAPEVEIADMPLEGPLIDSKLCRNVGVPNSEYFIMFDDTDFAYRLSQFTTIKYIRGARLHRKLATNNSKKTEWTWKEYYLLRNSFYFDKKYGKNVLVRKCRPMLSASLKIVSAMARKKPFRAKLVKKAFHDARLNIMGKQIEPGTDITRL